MIEKAKELGFEKGVKFIPIPRVLTANGVVVEYSNEPVLMAQDGLLHDEQTNTTFVFGVPFSEEENVKDTTTITITPIQYDGVWAKII